MAGQANPGVAQPQRPARGRPRPSPAQSLKGPTRRFPAWRGASAPHTPGSTPQVDLRQGSRLPRPSAGGGLSTRRLSAGLQASMPICTGRPVHAAASRAPGFHAHPHGEACPRGSCQQGSRLPRTYQFRRHKKHEFDPWVKKIPLSREQHSTPAILPEEFYEQRSLVGYSPWVTKSWT